MKPVAFDYVAPRSLDEALDALARGGEDAKPIAGGQSLVPALNLRIVRPSVVVDLRHTGLGRAEATTAGGLRTGATLRQAEMARDVRAHPLVLQALPHVGHVGTRNRGTVGGSLAHADGAAELPLCLCALEGSVTATGPDGTRTILADELFVTHYTTTLRPGELVTAVDWPPPAPGERSAFEELSLRAGDFGLSMVAVVLVRGERGRIERARVAVGSVVDRPTRLVPVEELLVGTRGDEAADDAGAAAAQLVDPAGSLHASARYLRHVTGVLVARALRRAA
jgi:CO/xanthine dehydrogenase FAD-binding subunit